MNQSMLQRFLNEGLLPIGDDDTSFKNLQKASSALATKLARKKAKVIPYTLVALDPQIPADEPVLTEIEQAVMKTWSTFRNKFPDTPTQILRAVIFEALLRASEKDDHVASIIWFTGRSYHAYLSEGTRSELSVEFLTTMGEDAEEKANVEWSIKPPSQKRRSSSSSTGSTDGAQTSRVNLKDLPQKLATHAAWPQAAAPTAKAIVQVHTSLTSEIDQIKEILPKYAADANATLSRDIEQALKSILAHEKRSNLLWWKELLYSHSLRNSYRTMSSSTAVFLMAHDLDLQLSTQVPQSVDYLLREAVREVVSGNDEKNSKLSDFLDGILESDERTDCQRLIAEQQIQDGRLSLLQFVRQVLGGHLSVEDMSQRTGIPADTEVDLEEIAVWLFGDFQALRLVG